MGQLLLRINLTTRMRALNKYSIRTSRYHPSISEGNNTRLPEASLFPKNFSRCILQCLAPFESTQIREKLDAQISADAFLCACRHCDGAVCSRCSGCRAL